jgi:MFS family permease
MSKKQLSLLFICSIVPWTIGNGLLPLLPIYVIKLGANPVIAGYYMSFAFFSLAAGTSVAGWLSDKLQCRKLSIIIAGVIAVPVVFLMGKAATVLYLAILNVISWFIYGMSIALVNIIAGLFAGEDERGKIFGIIGSTMALGGIIGGLSVGPLVDRWGYRTMFMILSGFSIILPITALFLEEKVIQSSQSKGLSTHENKSKLGHFLVFLLIAQGIAVIVNAPGNIGKSLAMDNLDFSSSAITSTMVVGGIILLLFQLLFGWLSDRIGRKRLMYLCFISFALSMLLFAYAKALWHFWVATSFLQIGFVSNSVGAALVTDQVQPERLGVGLSLFQNMTWLGIVIGYAVTGYAIQSIGIKTTFLLGISLPIIGFILLVPIRERVKE